jgi:signal transduction histidine kinase
LGRIRRIVEALRTFSRLDEAELKVVPLDENIQSTLLIARLELQGRVEVETDLAHLPAIKCYPAELNQVFLNVILNAAQAIPGKGKLTIRGRDAGDRIILTFTDTGVGMPPEVAARIFDPFFTTKPVGSGTGLGLTIAYKIITERHRGTITADSTPGVGTTITITLPKDLPGD